MRLGKGHLLKRKNMGIHRWWKEQGDGGKEKKMRWQTRRKQLLTDNSIYFLCIAYDYLKLRELFGRGVEVEKRQKEWFW